MHDLNQNEQPWSMPMDELGDGFCLLDTTGRIVQMNERFAQWGGRPISSLTGATLIRLLTEDVAKHHPNAFSKAIEDKPTAFFASFALPEAPRLYWRVRWKAPHLLVQVAHLERDLLDVSRKSKDILAAQLGLFTDASHENLSAQQAQWERFISVASHDLNAPLRKVLTFGQILEKKYSEGQDDRFKRYVLHIVDNTSRMQSLLESLLSYLRIEKERHVFAPKSLHKILDRAERRVKRADCAFTWPDEDMQVNVDAKLMETLVDHLFDNATRYVPAECDPCVTLNYEKRGDHLYCTIQDNGIGIQPHHADSIFDVFVRIKSEGIEPGHGIGLALSRQIITIHGGEMGVLECDEGACFWFTLPLV